MEKLIFIIFFDLNVVRVTNILVFVYYKLCYYASVRSHVRVPFSFFFTNTRPDQCVVESCSPTTGFENRT